MSDDGVQELISQKEVFNQPEVEVASTIMANPEHRGHSEDRAVAIELAGGKSALIVAADGMGSGGKDSAKTAQIATDRLNGLRTRFFDVPGLSQAQVALTHELVQAGKEIRSLQGKTNNQSADTTVSAVVLCEKPDLSGWNPDNRLGLIAHVGDSSIKRYTPSSGELVALTKDDTLVQRLVDIGQITKEAAFLHPDRNVISKTLGDVHSEEDINFSLVNVKPGDILLAVSDGLTDNLPPEGLPVAVRDEFAKAYDSQTKKTDMKRFTAGVAQRAHKVMVGTDAPHKKPDDITVAAMRVPRK